MKYYIVKSDAEKGPYNAKQIRDGLRAGTIAKHTLIRKEGATKTKPASVMFPEEPNLFEPPGGESVNASTDSESVGSYEPTQSRDTATSLLDQGKSAAEVWSALVSNGMEHAEAETLVRDLVELRRAQIERQREDEVHAGSGFCRECYKESTLQSPGNIVTWEGIGTTLYGRDRVCDDCSSVVGVHWVVFRDIPLFPLGTYRYRTLPGDRHGDIDPTFVARRTRVIFYFLPQKTQFVARRTQADPYQIAMHYAGSALGIAVFILAVLFARDKSIPLIFAVADIFQAKPQQKRTDDRET